MSSDHHQCSKEDQSATEQVDAIESDVVNEHQPDQCSGDVDAAICGVDPARRDRVKRQQPSECRKADCRRQ